ncbi:DoxX family protein [Cohnella nanjingensis]|uniref:DoxX family protein n=1 Tax=Cohnella nanjingensis TaxID=1387779 RepID=A0A7X0RN36_9BACL|nr:DoxX family protein [Cohnella nanjingensis]MBB6670431.1 DoxX family protein [Cohnella nanjingensis]
MNKGMRIAGWIVVGAAALFFVQNGIQKLAGAGQMVEMFDALGFPDWARIVVGLAELAGGILLAVPRTTLYAAAALSLLMIGAVVSEASAGHGFESLLPAQWLVVLGGIAGVRLRIRARARAKERS